MSIVRVLATCSVLSGAIIAAFWKKAFAIIASVPQSMWRPIRDLWPCRDGRSLGPLRRRFRQSLVPSGKNKFRVLSIRVLGKCHGTKHIFLIALRAIWTLVACWALGVCQAFGADALRYLKKNDDLRLHRVAESLALLTRPESSAYNKGECTAFLIGPRLVATAAHCLKGVRPANCNGVSVLFDYRTRQKVAGSRNLHDPLYHCKRIVALGSKDFDYALIELDRPVLDRRFLHLQYDRPETAEVLDVVGYGGRSWPVVRHVPHLRAHAYGYGPHHFAIVGVNIAHGMSGSPVVNAHTLGVIGIAHSVEEGPDEVRTMAYRISRLKNIIHTAHLESSAPEQKQKRRLFSGGSRPGKIQNLKVRVQWCRMLLARRYDFP